MTKQRKDWVIFAVLWVILTAIGEYLALGLHLLPGKYARESHVVDEAYVLLIAVAVPVFAMVVAALVTISLRFMDWDHRLGDQAFHDEDGPPVRTHKQLVPAWVGVSAILCAVIAINPGFIGLRDLRGESKADMVVKVQAQRRSWKFTYENGGVETTELVLPVDERIRFDLTSIDIVHSFWVPAFRVKLDTLPARITKLYVTPEREGTFEDDPTLRVQCAELCGRGHAAMAVPIRILSKTDFEAWVSGLKKEG